MILVLLGLLTVLFIAPIVQVQDPAWGWVTFGAGVTMAALGAYKELYSP